MFEFIWIIFELTFTLRQTLQYFERTRPQYEHTEYTIVGVHALMESMVLIYLIGVPNNFLDVIICMHIYRIICQLALVFNNQTIRLLAKMFLLQKVIY